MRTITLLAVVGVLTAVACGSSPSGPSSALPTSPSSPPAGATVTLSGIVYAFDATGRRPLAGARVEVTESTRGDYSNPPTTGADGRYVIGPVQPGHYLSGWKRCPCSSERHWMGVVRDVSVTVSSYQRLSEARLFPAEGPLTARAEGDRGLSTLGVKIDATRLTGRHAVKAGVDAVRLAPRETRSYTYDGYLEYTHLVGRPHVHVSVQEIAFDGAESGGQVSAYLQNSIQVGSRATLDVGVRVDRYRLIVSTTHVSPRVNFALRTGDRTVLHASYNHFFVPPPVEGVLSNSAGLTRSIDEIAVAFPPVQSTVEDQFEGGVTTGFGPFELALTSYHRATGNPVHTTIWPDSRIYSYASFHRARAIGVEGRLDVKAMVPTAVTGYLNYALGRMHFENRVTGGFVTEAAHIMEKSRFLAPMDQTHTMTGGTTYRHVRTGLLLRGAIEYGSGTPMGHGAAHDHAAGADPHTLASLAVDTVRVPGHVTANMSLGIDLLRATAQRPKLT